MKITNNTTTYQLAELMGQEADERDGRILMSLLTKHGITDTDEISDALWSSMLDEVCEIRRREQEVYDAESEESENEEA